jgi:hypothetical protein
VVCSRTEYLVNSNLLYPARHCIIDLRKNKDLLLLLLLL